MILKAIGQRLLIPVNLAGLLRQPLLGRNGLGSGVKVFSRLRSQAKVQSATFDICAYKPEVDFVRFWENGGWRVVYLILMALHLLCVKHCQSFGYEYIP